MAAQLWALAAAGAVVLAAVGLEMWRSRNARARALGVRFQVYTLPTTVVMSAEGRSLHVNYGYAPANKLQRQLADARGGDLRATATA